MSQNTRNVKRAYVEPPRQQATTDLKCQEVQGDFSLMINMAIKVNGESWNKSAERMCMCGYARARALPTTGPDTLYVHTPDHRSNERERVCEPPSVSDLSGTIFLADFFADLGLIFARGNRARVLLVIEDHSSTSEGHPIRAFPKSFEPRIWRAS